MKAVLAHAGIAALVVVVVVGVGRFAGEALAGKPPGQRKAAVVAAKAQAKQAAHRPPWAEAALKKWRAAAKAGNLRRSHAGIRLYGENAGGPGTLIVGGEISVNDPLPPGFPNNHPRHNIIISVHDRAGGEVARAKVGEWIDEAGVRDAKQEFLGRFELPRGGYRVTARVVNQTRMVRHLDGSQEPDEAMMSERGFEVE